MDFTVNYTIHIDVDEIIFYYNLNSSSSYNEINSAIIDWCACNLNEVDNDFINTEEIAQIRHEIKSRISGQMIIAECF